MNHPNQEQSRSGGQAVPWLDRELYTRLMLERSIASFKEHTPAPQPFFSDRGIPDTLCYARLIGLADTRAITTVFLAPPWDGTAANDGVRTGEIHRERVVARL